MARYVKTVSVKDINYVLSWKSKGLPDEKIESIKTANYLFNPQFDIYNVTKIRIKFNGGCLKRFPPTNASCIFIMLRKHIKRLVK